MVLAFIEAAPFDRTQGGQIMDQHEVEISHKEWDEAAEFQRFCDTVRDARELLDFAVSEWPMVLKRQDKPIHDIDESIRRRICEAEDFARQGRLPDKKERMAFEDAYFDLCAILAPINIRTVRATSDKYAAKGQVCEARQLARRLWWWTAIFIVFAAVGEVVFNVYKWKPDFEHQYWTLMAWTAGKFLFPFAYGGVGACAFLLRSGVGFIGSREFDPNFASEYANRVWLGVLIGGLAYHLLKDTYGGLGGIPVVTEAMFGFLGGYFNDRILRVFERLADAILPGVTLQIAESRERMAAPPVQRVSTESLIQFMKESQDPEDKKFVKTLLD